MAVGLPEVVHKAPLDREKTVGPLKVDGLVLVLEAACKIFVAVVV